MIRPNDKMPHNIQNDDNTHRIKRARSWVARSEKVKNREEKFICLWIAFNAAYGGEWAESEEYEIPKFKKFLGKIRKHDNHDWIGSALLGLDDYEKGAERKPIRNFLENRHVYEEFWKSVRSQRKGGRKKDWRKRFDEENRDVLDALDDQLCGNKNVGRVFEIIFQRLYQLRNQVFHGGATCGEKSWGWIQLEDANYIMTALVPVILEIMEQNPKSDWGKIAYPRIGDEPWVGDGGC